MDLAMAVAARYFPWLDPTPAAQTTAAPRSLCTGLWGGRPLVARAAVPTYPGGLQTPTPHPPLAHLAFGDKKTNRTHQHEQEPKSTCPSPVTYFPPPAFAVWCVHPACYRDWGRGQRGAGGPPGVAIPLHCAARKSRRHASAEEREMRGGGSIYKPNEGVGEDRRGTGSHFSSRQAACNGAATGVEGGNSGGRQRWSIGGSCPFSKIFLSRTVPTRRRLRCNGGADGTAAAEKRMHKGRNKKKVACRGGDPG